MGRALPTIPEPEYSDRGFAHWPPVESSYGATVRVYESSAAENPHLWVNIDGDCHLSGHAEPFPGLPWGKAPGAVSAHLTMNQARELRDRLDAAITHSEQRFGVSDG